MVQRDGLFKRGKIWWVRTDPITWKQVSTGQTERKQALLWRAERQRQAGDPRVSAAEKATLGEWISRTIAVKATDKSAATLMVYRQKLGHFARIWGPDLVLARITPQLCDSYTAQRRTEASDHTICKEFSALTQLLKLARRSGCYTADIAALRPTDLAPHYKPRTRALPPSEVDALLGQLRGKLRALVAISVSLGTRLSETLRLTKPNQGRPITPKETVNTEEYRRAIARQRARKSTNCATLDATRAKRHEATRDRYLPGGRLALPAAVLDDLAKPSRYPVDPSAAALVGVWGRS